MKHDHKYGYFFICFVFLHLYWRVFAEVLSYPYTFIVVTPLMTDETIILLCCTNTPLQIYCPFFMVIVYLPLFVILATIYFCCAAETIYLVG